MIKSNREESVKKNLSRILSMEKNEISSSKPKYQKNFVSKQRNKLNNTGFALMTILVDVGSKYLKIREDV